MLKLFLAALAAALLALASGSRPQINCNYCIPDPNSNKLCDSDAQITQQIECSTGRCLIMSARFKNSNQISRLYSCDTFNIIDWAFQTLRIPGDAVAPNTCGTIQHDNDEVLTMLREYGMRTVMSQLLLGKAPDYASEVGSLADAVEMCTCESGDLCNTGSKLAQWTAIPAGSKSGSITLVNPPGNNNVYVNTNNNNGYVNNPPPPNNVYINTNNNSSGNNNGYVNNPPPPNTVYINNPPPVGNANSYTNNQMNTPSPQAPPAAAASGGIETWWYWLIIVALAILLILAVLALVSVIRHTGHSRIRRA